MTAQAELDRAASSYDARADDYDLDKDPRCLFGWGPPSCDCMFGHACFRALGHPGRCWDAGESPARRPNPLPCWQVRRPRDWDAVGRRAADT